MPHIKSFTLEFNNIFMCYVHKLQVEATRN